MNTLKKKIAALAASIIAAASVSVPLVSAGVSIGSIGEAVGNTLNYILTDDEMSEVRTSTVTVSGSEYVLKYGDAPEILSTENTYNAGDINCDGVMDKADLDLLEAYLNGEDCDITDQGITNADFNGDDTLDFTDYDAIEELLIYINSFEFSSDNQYYYTVQPSEMFFVRVTYDPSIYTNEYADVEWSYEMDGTGQTYIYETNMESGEGYVEYFFTLSEEAVAGCSQIWITASNDFCTQTWDVLIEFDVEELSEITFDIEYTWKNAYGLHSCTIESDDGYDLTNVSVSGAEHSIVGSNIISWTSTEETVTISGLRDGNYIFTSEGWYQGTYGGGGCDETIVYFAISDGIVSSYEVTSWSGDADCSGNAFTVYVETWQTTTTMTTTTTSSTTTYIYPYVSLYDPYESDLYVGNTFQMNYTLAYSGSALSWSSSDESVATVDSAGNVTINGTGEVTITVESSAPSLSPFTESDSVTFTVSEKQTTTTTTTTTSATTTQSNLTPLIIPSSLTMNIGDTGQLTVLNTNDETVTWLTNNTSVATVTDGTVTAVAEGTAVIYAVVGNTICECTVTVNGASGILYGDADCDGDVTISDVVKIMAHITTPGGVLTEKGKNNADVYQRGDGISNMDALAVQKRIAQLITSLPESVLE